MFGQATLAHFPLAGNTNASTNNVGASVALFASTTWNDNRVYFDEENDNVVLTANTSTHNDLYVSFNTQADFPWYSFYADLIVEYRTNASAAFTTVETRAIGESLTLRTFDLPAGVNNQSFLQIRIRVNSGLWGMIWCGSMI